MTPEELAAMDPFTTIWLTFGTRSSSGASLRCFHLNPACPALREPRGKKGRLGAQLAAGRRLCAYEVRK